MKKVILISGKQGSGKSTVAHKLVYELIDPRVSRAASEYKFADIIYSIHDFALETLQKHGVERDIVKDGPLLQLIGTEWGRNTIDKNIWVKCLSNKIEKTMRFTKETDIFFVVSDCRFKNEFDAFPDALSVRLECSKEVRKARCSQWRDRDDHPSEIDLDEYVDQGKFDLVYDSELIPADMIVADILKELQLNAQNS